MPIDLICKCKINLTTCAILNWTYYVICHGMIVFHANTFIDIIRVTLLYIFYVQKFLIKLKTIIISVEFMDIDRKN